MAKRLHSDSVSSLTSAPTPWTIFTSSTHGTEADKDSSAGSSQPKHVRLDPRAAEPAPEIRCYLPPSCSGRPFASHEQFESHYMQAHSNRCLECRRNFPSPRFLDLHIAENHDPLNELKRERGDKTYACFVEGCDRLCSTPQKRRLHLIDKHHFPKEYNWDIIKRGIDRCTSLLTRKRPPQSPPQVSVEGDASPSQGKNRFRSTNGCRHKGTSAGSPKGKSGPKAAAGAGSEESEKSPQEGEGPNDVPEAKTKEINMDDVASSMASMSLVPTSVRFGRRGGGFRR